MDGKKILIVDDSELISMMLQEQLENEGYETVRAVNGAEGIEKVYTEKPDLIIIDVEMPVMKGYQASRLLKSRRDVKKIPIIMHTSCSEDRDKMWAYSSGADAYIVKDADNSDALLKKAEELITASTHDSEMITNAGNPVTQDNIIEILNNLYDYQLFNSTILNMLADVGRNIEDLDKTVENIMSLTANVCESAVVVLMVPMKKKIFCYMLILNDTHKSDVDRLIPLCLNDYCKLFSTAEAEDIEYKIFGIEERDDLNP